MRRFIIVWITLMVLFSGMLTAVAQESAADVSLSITCIEHKEDATLVHFGYTASADVAGTSYWGPVSHVIEHGTPPNGLTAGQHDDVFALEVLYWPISWQFAGEDGPSAEIEVNEDTAAIDCDDLESPYGPDGGLQTVTKEVAPGCYEWSIADDYGHWSTVATTCSQQEGERVFVRLVLGRDNPVTDAARYRVWRVEG